MDNAIEHNTPPKLVSYRPNGRSNPSALEISLDPRRTDTIIFLLFGFINQQSAISSQHIQASLKTLKKLKLRLQSMVNPTMDTLEQCLAQS